MESKAKGEQRFFSIATQGDTDHVTTCELS